MKNKRTLSILLFLTVAVFTLSGCNFFGVKPAGAASSAPANSQVEESTQATDSSVSSGAPSSVSSPASSTAPVEPPTESQNGPVLPVETDDKAFNSKFAANPIDKAYIKDEANAISNVDMVNVSNQYSDIWQKEITHAYAELEKHMATDSSTKPQQLKAEQKQWLSGKSAALKKISSAAQAAGGSMAQVNEAGGIMDFYRSRAAQIYKELYSYDKDYSYEYKTK